MQDDRDPHKPPRVSVVVAAFNAASTLAETLSSVAAQTYRDFELIAVDDGSSDATAQLLKTSARQWPWLLWERQENGGVAGARMRGIELSRGDWIGTPQTMTEARRFSATLAWLDTEPAVVGRKYWVRHGNRWVQARISSIDHRLDIHTLQPTDAHELAVNEIGHVTIETQAPLPVEAYLDNRVGGALIVVDPTTNRTSGALLVKKAQ